MEHGLQFNFKVGKTTAMVLFCGKGSEATHRQVEAAFVDGLPIMTEHTTDTRLPLVDHYKHLGGFVAEQGHLLPELRVRAAQTLARLAPLRKLTTQSSIDCPKKALLLKSMALSVLSVHAGAWFNLQQGEFDVWRSGVFRTYQSMVKIVPQQASRWTLVELAHMMRSAMPMELIVAYGTPTSVGPHVESPGRVHVPCPHCESQVSRLALLDCCSTDRF